MSSPNSWPLPNSRLLLDGLEADPGEGRVRTPMEFGPPKMRRRFTAAVRRVRGVVMVNGNDLRDLLAWGKGPLKEWSQSFAWYETTEDRAADFQFVRPPRWTLVVPSHLPSARLWRVECEFEILP